MIKQLKCIFTGVSKILIPLDQIYMYILMQSFCAFCVLIALYTI